MLLGPRSLAWWIVRFWARSHLWLLKAIVGTDHVVHGKHKLPKGGCIIAPKHQAAWDTFAFLPWWPAPAFILKRELTWIPLFGWYLTRMRMIAIDRGNREQAIRLVNAGARTATDEGRQLIIYPEGTRRPPGAKPSYKPGIGHIYETLDVPIPPGLPREVFMARLIERMEAASDRLLQRAAAAPDAPPLPESARARLAELAGGDARPGDA